ncbi:MAG: hypothetical protein V3T83_07870 [Acidobacteriota bacterium]
MRVKGLLKNKLPVFASHLRAIFGLASIAKYSIQAKRNSELAEQIGPAIPAFSLNRAKPKLTQIWARNSGIYF